MSPNAQPRSELIPVRRKAIPSKRAWEQEAGEELLVGAGHWGVPTSVGKAGTVLLPLSLRKLKYLIS